MAERKLPFASGNRAMAFNPLTAFPLDGRCYFEPATVDGVAKSGLTLAEEAAALAEDVGSKNTVYHYGMKLLVKDGNATDGYTFTWYEITKDKTLVPESLKGVGISSIEKTSTEGLVDTYTIILTDGNTSTFTVTNGVQGGDGDPGYTPQKGVDYYTEADKAEMVEAVLNALPNGDVEEY